MLRFFHAVDPLRDLRACRNGSNASPRSTATAWAPPIDVYETDGPLRHRRGGPGLTREQIELALAGQRG